MFNQEDRLAEEKLLNSWVQDPNGAKKVYQRLRNLLNNWEGVNLFFKARPGISYSLRVQHAQQKHRQLFTMIDVIDDDPNERWLSICFYQDMISDPEEEGDLVPGGLLGEDGYCFDLDDNDLNMLQYIETRLEEAYKSASKGN